MAKFTTNATDEELYNLAIIDAKTGDIKSAMECVKAIRDEELRKKAEREVKEIYEKGEWLTMWFY